MKMTPEQIEMKKIDLAAMKRSENGIVRANTLEVELAEIRREIRERKIKRRQS